MQVNNIITALEDVIAKHQLELLQRYPDDLRVHDRHSLEKFAHAGASIAWMVGHSHTHIVILGIHPNENELVGYLTHLANDDRFYLISVARDDFTLKEITREAFAELNRTPVPYRREGTADSFWLFNGDRRIGHCAITRNSGYEATLTPVAGASELEKGAMLIWSEKACVELAHSLFFQSTVTWADEIRLPMAA